jgi:hypothetical protein
LGKGRAEGLTGSAEVVAGDAFELASNGGGDTKGATG